MKLVLCWPFHWAVQEPTEAPCDFSDGRLDYYHELCFTKCNCEPRKKIKIHKWGFWNISFCVLHWQYPLPFHCYAWFVRHWHSMWRNGAEKSKDTLHHEQRNIQEHQFTLIFSNGGCKQADSTANNKRKCIHHVILLYTSISTLWEIYEAKQSVGWKVEFLTTMNCKQSFC